MRLRYLSPLFRTSPPLSRKLSFKNFKNYKDVGRGYGGAGRSSLLCTLIFSSSNLILFNYPTLPFCVL